MSNTFLVECWFLNNDEKMHEHISVTAETEQGAHKIVRDNNKYTLKTFILRKNGKETTSNNTRRF